MKDFLLIVWMLYLLNQHNHLQKFKTIFNNYIEKNQKNIEIIILINLCKKNV